MSGLHKRFPESPKLVLGQPPGSAFPESEDPGAPGTHCARRLRRTLQKEILGDDKEAGQHAEAADDVCDQVQHFLQAKNKSDNRCPRLEAQV